jgi:tyrosyl-tRNA synthetase
MRRLQKAGHTPVALIGSATGMIGDPSGKSEERVLLDQDTIERNVKGIASQIDVFLDSSGANGYKLVRNDTWLSSVGFIDFLRDVGKHFSVNAMMAKDSVKSRLENREQGISYTEFSYMLLQAYDFFWLNQNMNCELQVGGSDQWGNITAGLELIRRKSNDDTAKAFGLTFPLLTTSGGGKFGKTEKGAVWLDSEKTSPYEFYQFWYNTSDSDISVYLNLFSDFDDAEIADLLAQTESAPEKRVAQTALASQLCELVHGTDGKQKAEAASSLLFGGSLDDVDSNTLLSVFKDVPSKTITRSEFEQKNAILDILVISEAAESKSAARRLVEGGGIYVNNERVSDSKSTISIDKFIDGSVLLLRSGKKKYYLLKLQ